MVKYTQICLSLNLFFALDSLWSEDLELCKYFYFWEQDLFE